MDDWAILPVVPVLYVREVARTASGSTRQVPYFYAPSFDTKTVEQLFESYGVPQADPEDSVLGKGSQYGAAGVLSYIAWEWAFWIGSFGIAALLFNLYEGHLPDLRFAASLDFNLPLNHIDLLQTKSGMVSIDLPSFPLQFTAHERRRLCEHCRVGFCYCQPGAPDLAAVWRWRWRRRRSSRRRSSRRSTG